MTYSDYVVITDYLIISYHSSLLYTGVITLRDLKNSQLSSMFFNTFINIEKYLDYEQRDPVALSRVRIEREREREREAQYCIYIM